MEIFNLEFLDFHNSSSRIHRSHECERPRDDINLRFQFMDRILYYQGLFYIPDGPCQLQVLQSYHDFLAAWHFGFNKTMELILCNFWRPQMWKTVKDYITICNICSRSKVSHHHLYGLLHPLPIPEKPWSSISMVFIIDFLSSNDFHSIFVVVDRLTKMVYFMSCNKTVIGEEIARHFMDNIFKYHGLPDNIISNHGSQFTLKFWQSLLKILKVKIKLSSTYHP